VPNAVVTLQLQNQAAPAIRQTADATKALAAEEARAQQATLSRAQAVARLQLALGQNAQAERTLSQALQGVTTETTGAIRAQIQLVSIQQRGASSAQAQAASQRQAMDAMRASVSPTQVTTQSTNELANAMKSLTAAAGVVGVGLGVAQIIQFGKGAIEAANSLEKTESTVNALSGSATRYKQVLAVAQAGQQAYGGSLEENLAGLGTLVNLSNRASVSLSQLDNISRRLAVVDPVQGIQGANIALKEFLSGNNAEAALSLARRFELPRAALADLAKEGTTAQQRLDGLNKLLNEQGITTQVLTDRTKTQAATYDRLGAAALNARDAIGALLAAQGAGAAGDATGALSGVTNLISAYNGLATAHKGVADAVGVVVNPIGTYNSLVLKGGADALRWLGVLAATKPAVDSVTTAVAASIPIIQLRATAFDEDRVALGKAQIASQQFSQAIQLEGAAKVEAQIHTADLARQQAQLEADSIAAAKGIFASGDQALALATKYGIAVNAARFLISEQQKIALSAGPAEGRAERDTASDRSALHTAQRTRADAIADARSARTLATGTASAQIAERQRLFNEAVKLHGKESVEAVSAETALIQARQAAASAADKAGRSRQSALTKELNLSESLYDSLAKQRDAMLDIEELTIRDRQQDRADKAKIAQAQRILASPNARADFKDAARDSLALIDVLDRKRAAELASKGTTAGASIVNGKLIQSQPGGALPPPPPSGPLGALPSPVGAPVRPSAAAAGMPAVNVYVTLDGAPIAANVIVRLAEGQRRSDAAGGGGG
jgi:hypothetical protein